MSYSSNSFFKDRVSSANIGAVSHCSVIECFQALGLKDSPQSSKPLNRIPISERHKSPHPLTTLSYGFLLNYKDAFTNEAIQRGYSEQNIQRCLDYAAPLFSNAVPVIYNTSHLSVLGYKRVSKESRSSYQIFYRDFEVVKRNGKKRPISEPLPSLKEIQYWILKNILYTIPVSPFAKAYKPNVSLIENLKFHRNQPKVFTLDLENFSLPLL
jgi:RNA-directed DNA polymerase